MRHTHKTIHVPAEWWREIEESSPPVPPRPPCPECGAKHPVSHGESWRCRHCGRWWLKMKRLDQSIGTPDYSTIPGTVEYKIKHTFTRAKVKE